MYKDIYYCFNLIINAINFICWQERYHNINLLSWFFYISDLHGKKFKLVNLQFFFKIQEKKGIKRYCQTLL